MSQLPQIKPPSNLSPKPDKATKLGMPDLTGDEADGRVLRINLWFFKYGVDDKVHAAAVAFSLILLILITAVIFVGMKESNTAWVEKAFSWLGNAFLFVAGIALGGSSTDNKKIRNHDDDES